MGIGTDLTNSILGNVETAYLVVDDYRALCRPAEDSTEGAGALKAAASKALKGGAAAGETSGGTPKYFKVQFNPAQLQMNAALTQETKLDAQVADKAGKRTVADALEKPTITLQVSLIFDDTNLSDAFMAEKLTAGVGAVATLGTNIATGAAMALGRKWSVQPQVEALLGTLHNNYTRYLTFYWSKFSFAGQLTNVAARYTMFSTAGRPIRATVDLRIRQEMDPAALNTWYQEFADSFGVSTSLTGAAQRVGNLFNLNL